MRLNRLDLTRFGRFTDRALTFAPPDAPGGPDLHIVYGPNEAGKSTAFAAWLDLLFGIPPRTRHDFLHPGPTLRIGAQLDLGDRVIEVARVKKTAGSLLDGADMPLPEALLQAALGGIGRDGYKAMFSLDDETLEEGGDSILASKGDLGEMLFAASAGLARMSARLAGLREKADAFHRPGGRKGPLSDAKATLADLGQRRREIDVEAGEYLRLTQAATTAEADWRAARAELAHAEAALAALVAQLAVVPQRERLARLRAQLAPSADLPDPPQGTGAALARLAQDLSAVQARIAERTGHVARRQAARAALDPDAAVLAQAAAIREAEALRALHDAAVADLPGRRQDAQEAAARLRAALLALGLAGGHEAADPRPLLCDEARLAGLRALLARWSGLDAARDAAAAAQMAANDRVARLQDRLAATGAARDSAALVALTAALRRDDPAEALRRAQRDSDAAGQGLDARLAALAPWRGAAADLAALDVPDAGQIAAWQARRDAARAAQADATRAVTAAQAALRAHDAAEAPPLAAGPTPADAVAARIRREALWAAHRQSLSPQSAVTFEAALRDDDRILAETAEARLAQRMQAAGEAAAAARAAALAAAAADLRQAEADSAQVLGEIAAACGALGLRATDLAALRDWLEARRLACEAHAAATVAQQALTRAKEALAEAATALAALLAPVDPAVRAGGYAALWAEAEARILADRQAGDLRRNLDEAREEAQARAAARGACAAAITAWEADWAARTAGHPLAALPRDVAALGRTLDLLGELGQAVAAQDALAHRIGGMEANRDAFGAAAQAIRDALALPGATPWADILARLRAAQEAARAAAAIDVELAEAQALAADDLLLRDHLIDRRAALAATLGVEANADLDGRLAACRAAAALRREITETQQTLDATPGADAIATPGDIATLAAQADETRAGVDLLRARAESSFAHLSETRRQLEAVGGDDAAARIEAARRNLLLDLEDQARAHLALRLGVQVVEQGLRAYRDSHRSAMLARASEAFRILSRNAYSGLAAQPDGPREVLVALAAGGGAKLAPDLSKGTRFQLYLALRIAGYHELAASRRPVPFIADDIMETFDDDRSAEAFTLLAEMSHKGQVIYFTHHHHLCDIARRVCPGARVQTL
ncbi:MAG: AAA family ATPase [Rhodobacterales bacterium]|nr:AAA family ATPase [Rhodobacterales bacterium]NCT12620.1 AAA family ATPase [Rhodobacterales bacterium]